MTNSATAGNICTIRNNFNDDDFALESFQNPRFNRNGLDDIFNEYKKVVFQSVVTAFALDGLLFQDRDGGNVQTVHNFEQGVYANDTFRERGESTYDRNVIAPSKILHDKRKRDFSKNETITDGYTGKQLKKDGSTEVDHIVSAKEIHDTAKHRMLNSDEELRDLANDERNFAYTEQRINRSKSDKSMDEWANTTKRGESQQNAERYGINRKMAAAKDKAARKFLNEDALRKEIRHYAKEVPKDCLKTGGKMAIRQGVGFICVELGFVLFEEFPNAIKRQKINGFDLGVLLNDVADIFKKAVDNIRRKFSELLTKIGDGFFAGILSSLVTLAINMLKTTVANVVKIIRQAMSSVAEALRILVRNPENLTKRQKIKAIAKIIFTGISVVVGTIANQAVQTFLSQSPLAAVPFVGSELVTGISLFASALCSGLLSVSLLYFIDNSPIVDKIINFFTNANLDEMHQDLVYNNETLDRYISRLMEIDLAEYERNVNEFHAFSAELETASDPSSVMYKLLETRGVKLQFSNFDEFNACMEDENFILEL
ncbi:MAG: hypothetical protein FWG64_01850 [Firmicutes bacterium]|nr:hypothetical protein [Bacillota bacterium]